MEKHFPAGFENYLKSLGYSENTCAAYIKDILLFHRDYQKSGGETFDESNLFNYFNKLSKNQISAATLERKKASLKSYSNYLNLLHKENPIDTKKLISPKKPKKIPHHLLKSEMAQILEFMDKSDELAHRNYMMLLLFYSTGIRLSELLSIRPGQINQKERSLKVMGKGSKERLVYLPEKVIKEYQEYEQRFQVKILLKNRIFLNAQGNPLSSRGVEYIIEQIGRQCKIGKNLHPHIFRHTFATQVLENGADIRKVGEFLGHESLDTTQKYTHLSRKKLKETLEKFHPHAS